jgi:hydrogenase expression/formation protein HypC
MCLAIPGKIEEITNKLDDTFRVGRVVFGEVKKEINLSMVPEAKEGDYVMVHVGVAISVVDEEEANKTFELLKQMGELNDLNLPESLG